MNQEPKKASTAEKVENNQTFKEWLANNSGEEFADMYLVRTIKNVREQFDKRFFRDLKEAQLALLAEIETDTENLLSVNERVQLLKLLEAKRKAIQK